MVIVLECAEDLGVKELIMLLAQLAELSGKPVMTLFISEVSWFDIRPPLAAAPDLFLIDVPILSKQGRHTVSNKTDRMFGSFGLCI